MLNEVKFLAAQEFKQGFNPDLTQMSRELNRPR